MVIRVAPFGSVNCEVSGFRIVVDPAPRERGELVLRTAIEPAAIGDELPGVITNAGEYELSGIRVTGLDMEGESDKKILKTTYIVEADEVRMCFLAPITKEPTDAFLEKLGEIDILFITCGKGLIEAKKAAAIVKEIEPHIVVPRNTETAEGLISEIGKSEQMDRLVIKHKDLENEEGTKLIWIREK
jgi:hypothetical protein